MCCFVLLWLIRVLKWFSIPWHHILCKEWQSLLFGNKGEWSGAVVVSWNSLSSVRTFRKASLGIRTWCCNWSTSFLHFTKTVWLTGYLDHGYSFLATYPVSWLAPAMIGMVWGYYLPVVSSLRLYSNHTLFLQIHSIYSSLHNYLL